MGRLAELTGVSVTRRIDRRAIGTGVAAGVAAYLLGYLVTYVTQRGTVTERLRAFNFLAELLGGDPIPPWKGVGWLFYNAHFVATTVPGLAGTRTANLVASEGGSLALLYLLPPVVLLTAGGAVAAASSADAPGPGAGVGALVAAGYLPLALLGAVLFRFAVGDGAVAPDPVTAALLAGTAYPLVFGAAGGAAAGAALD